MRTFLTTGMSALLIVLALGGAAFAQSCRLALVLALDVSGSVDAAEYTQQVNGLATALDHPDVRAQILDGSGLHVSLAVYEWSSRNHQYVIQPWTALTTNGALDAAITRIRGHQKVRAGLRTAMGTSLSFAASLFRAQSDCWVKTVDVSGDGKNNIGITPVQLYQSGAFDEITVNALVIGGSGASQASAKHDLLRYFETEVIHGSSSFAMIAHGYDDYADAMRRKLIRELQVPVFGASKY
ncbi:DUF1194 domain-containing protein [Tateyamaria sp.]|uniref:DUF1194 domain-containing protein n=1 Tax=Tateyamaria sp. TaxID=1929288 RepID=UPI00329CC385